MKDREESGTTLGFLVQATGRMELPLTELRKTVGNRVSGRRSRSLGLDNVSKWKH